MKVYCVLLVLSILTVGCKNTMELVVHELPEVQLPNEVNKIVVIDQVQSNVTFDRVVNAVLGVEQIDASRQLKPMIMKGLMERINTSSQYSAEQFVLIDNENNWANIDSMAISQGYDLVVVIHSIRAQSEIGGVLLANWKGQKFDAIQGTIELGVHRVGSGNSQDYITLTKNFKFQLRGGIGPLHLAEDVWRKREQLKDMGYELGKSAAQLFEMKKAVVQREYYTFGAKEIRQTRKLYKVDEFDKAYQKLERNYQEYSGKKKKARALYNLAVLSECLGELDEAIDYCESAVLAHETDEARELLGALQERRSSLTKSIQYIQD